MKVWRVLGTRSGAFPSQVILLAGGAFLCAALFYRGPGRFFVMLGTFLAAYGFGMLLRRIFDGRDEVLFLLWRTLSGSCGGYTLLERDRRR